jgi:predicted transcriptional regulator
MTPQAGAHFAARMIPGTNMIQPLSRDEFDALEEVHRTAKGAKPSACVARNAKKLCGVKILLQRRDGTYALTEKGSEALFMHHCIKGLRAIATDPGISLDPAVATFLGRKGHIAANASGAFEITAKGRECLEDIANNPG